MSLSWVMVLKLPKIVQFLQNCVDLCTKSKSIIAIYLYRSERPPSENRCFIGVWATVHDIEEKNIDKSADSAEILQNSTT